MQKTHCLESGTDDTYVYRHGLQRKSTLEGGRGGLSNNRTRIGLRVDEVLQLFAGLEIRHPLGRNFDFLSGLGIPPNPGVSPAEP